MSENENLEPKHIKCVNFDLSTEELKKHFPNGTAKPYELIKQFFLDRGFERQQYSGYISKEPLDDAAVLLIMKELGATFTWLEDCIQQFGVSNAPDNLSQVETITDSARKAKDRQQTKIQTLTQKLDKEVAYYIKHKHSFYPDAKIHTENTIIGLCNELLQNGETLKDNNFKTFQAIIKERNGGREL